MLVVLKFWLVAEFSNSTSCIADYIVCGKCVDTNRATCENFASSVSLLYVFFFYQYYRAS